MAAAYHGHANSVRALLDGGADATLLNDDGMTAQDLARQMSRVGSGHLQIIQMLAKAQQPKAEQAAVDRDL